MLHHNSGGKHLRMRRQALYHACSLLCPCLEESQQWPDDTACKACDDRCSEGDLGPTTQVARGPLRGKECLKASSRCGLQGRGSRHSLSFGLEA